MRRIWSDMECASASKALRIIEKHHSGIQLAAHDDMVVVCGNPNGAIRGSFCSHAGRPYGRARDSRHTPCVYKLQQAGWNGILMLLEVTSFVTQSVYTREELENLRPDVSWTIGHFEMAILYKQLKKNRQRFVAPHPQFSEK